MFFKPYQIVSLWDMIPVYEAVAELSTTAKSKLADFGEISAQGDLSPSE
jgi:hypothetical protein